jgi:hypothetical protein
MKGGYMNMDEEKLKGRAIGYALSLLCFQEVGAGEDKFLGDVREIVAKIIKLCEEETGIKLNGYPTEFLKENKKFLMENKLPYTLLKITKENIIEKLNEK